MRVTWVDIGHDRERSLSGHTYLFVGSDGGIERPSGDEQDTEGSRADVLILVQVNHEGGVTAVSIPRDLVVTGLGRPARITLSLLEGPQTLVESVCSTLGVSVDRYVEIDAAGFAAAVNALGGVSLHIAAPIRDPAASLSLDSAGEQLLAGEDALALVRSRHAEVYDGQTWISIEDQGATDRARHGTEVLDAIRRQLSDASSLTLLSAVWSASDALTVAGGVHPEELRELAESSLAPEVLAVSPLGAGLAKALDDEGRRQLHNLGFDTGCTVT
ncbi:MAG: hypothetical protein GX814_07435 [Microbacteriaceae bacterium]|nr:hypothetical protein [Microbacteriaceae bacterium]